MPFGTNADADVFVRPIAGMHLRKRGYVAVRILTSTLAAGSIAGTAGVAMVCAASFHRAAHRGGVIALTTVGESAPSPAPPLGDDPVQVITNPSFNPVGAMVQVPASPGPKAKPRQSVAAVPSLHAVSAPPVSSTVTRAVRAASPTAAPTAASSPSPAG